jgi:hypothetical protein
MNKRRRFKAKRMRRIKRVMLYVGVVDFETAGKIVDLHPDGYIHGIRRSGELKFTVTF